MSRDFFRGYIDDGDEENVELPQRPAPGKVTLTSRLKPVQRRRATSTLPTSAEGHEFLAQPVQRKVAPSEHDDPFALHVPTPPTDASPDSVHAVAARGVTTSAEPLPHLAEIQRSFGRHDVSHVPAHVGGAAAEASAAMGAEAYATGGHVAFKSPPDLHTAAHEAAHVVQQQGGVHLKGGLGEEDDVYERHADAVARKVVAGESAEALLDEMAGAGGATSSAAVQHKRRGDRRGESGSAASSAVEVDDTFASVLDALERGIQTRDYFAANEAMRDALDLLPRVDELLRTGPARSADEQAATERMRLRRRRFEALAPSAPNGGSPSEAERTSWVARTPVSLERLPEQSRPGPGAAAPATSIPPSTEHAPITGIPVRPDDKADRKQEEYLGRHWDQLRESARRYFAAHLEDWTEARLRWAPGVDAEKRASTIVDAIFPTLHIAGHLERFVAPKALGDMIDLGAHMTVRDGESDGDPSWNPSVGTAVAQVLNERLVESMTRMGGQYVAAYDRNGGDFEAAGLPRQHPMDGVVAALLTQEISRVMGPVPRTERHGARKPRKWRWLGNQDQTLWNWIEVTDPRDASPEDVVLLLPPDVPPLVLHDGGFFRMPEEWARTQPGAAELAPPSNETPTGTELAASRFAPRAAIAEVKGQPRVRWTREQFDHAVHEIQEHLNELGSILGQQYAERVAAAAVIVGAADVADKALRADLANVFAYQVPLLRAILEETKTFHAISLARGRSRGRGPVEAVYLALALAAGNSHLYHVGRRHFDAARAKAADVDKQLAKEALTSASAGAASLQDVGGAGADDARDRQRDRFDALDSNTADPGAMHVDISIDSFVLHTQTLETQLDAMMDALFATRERLGPQLGSMFAMGLITAAEDLGSAVGNVRDQAAAVRLWLLDKVKAAPSASGRQEFLERAQKALGDRITSTQIITLTRRVSSMLERVDNADRALQIIHATVVMLEISIVSAGVGMAVTAAATTPAVAAARAAGVITLGRVGAATAGIVAETATSTLLQVGLLGDDPAKALGENLLATAATIVALRGYHAVTERFGPFTAENMRLWEQLGGSNALAAKTMNVTLEMALGAGSGYLATTVIRGPVPPSEDEGLELAMQGASIVASHWIMQRMHQSRTHLQAARAGLPADVVLRLDATMKSIDELQARAHAIAVKPVDKPVIVDMYAEHHRIIGAEAALVGDQSDGAASVGKAPANRSSGDTSPPTHEVNSDTTLGDSDTRRKPTRVAAGRRRGTDKDGHSDFDDSGDVTDPEPTRRRRKDPPGDDDEPGNRGAPYRDWRETDAERHPKEHTPRRQLLRYDDLAPRQTWAEVAHSQSKDELSLAIGRKISADTGHAVLARLSTGDIRALELIGIHDAPHDYSPLGREWALIQVRDGYVLYAGAYDEVLISLAVRVVGHIHPMGTPSVPHSGDLTPELILKDPVRGDTYETIIQDRRNALGSGIAPSALDIHRISDGTPHVLYTGFVHAGERRILPPSKNDTRPRVEIHLANAYVVKSGVGGSYWYEVDAVVKDATGAPLWANKIQVQWLASMLDGTVFFGRVVQPSTSIEGGGDGRGGQP